MGMFFQTLKAVLVGALADFFYTPVWWYTRGLLRQLQGVFGSLSARQRDLALDVWMKNLFVPMYGQYDIVGRLISFFMRLVQIIGRMLALIIWAVLLLGWLLIWVAIPAGVAYLVYVQISSLV